MTKPRNVRGRKRDKRKRTASQGGPPAHRQSVERLLKDRQLQERRQLAYDLHLNHLTMVQIAEALAKKGMGVDVSTVCRDIQFMHDLEEREFALSNHHARTRQRAVISRAMRALLPDLNDRKPQTRQEAVDRIVALLSREAKLLGLDARHESGESPERVMALVRGMMDLVLDVVSDPALQRRLLDGVRARLRPALQGEVIVTPRQEEEA